MISSIDIQFLIQMNVHLGRHVNGATRYAWLANDVVTPKCTSGENWIEEDILQLLPLFPEDTVRHPQMQWRAGRAERRAGRATGRYVVAPSPRSTSLCSRSAAGPAARRLTQAPLAGIELLYRVECLSQ
eukprot:g36302.t1